MTETLTRPGIDAVIGQVLKTTTHDKPADIADEVVRQISPTDYRVYLKQLIIGRLPSVAGSPRRKTPAAGVSTKQKLIREQYWPQFLASKVATPSGYKTMAELTAEDLRGLAQFRRAQGQALFAEGDRYERLAAAVEAAGVKVLEQLPQDAGQKALEA